MIDIEMYKLFSARERVKMFVILLFTIPMLMLSCHKDEDKETEPIKVIHPELTIQDIKLVRTHKQESGRFFVELSTSAVSEASFEYMLVEGSAKKDVDFVSSHGKVIIAVGQKTTSIEIFINANTERKPNIDFSILLSNAKGCTFKNSTATCTIVTENGEDLLTSNVGYHASETYAGKSLVWSDEFADDKLNVSNWNQEIGNGNGGWGNNELQYYTQSTKNTFISNGNLIIEARTDEVNGFKYSSGRMTTKGKKEFKFGRIDIRAKLPKGKGIWPALWMLGANINTVGWPACGEIDIMELIGSEPNKVHGTLHWKGTNGHVYKGGSVTLANGDYSQEFHVFSLIWEEDKIEWLVDDKIFYTLKKSEFGNANYPFNAPQFFIMNIAVGGNWPGLPDVSTQFPQRLFVDYIRVFQ